MNRFVFPLNALVTKSKAVNKQLTSQLLKMKKSKSKLYGQQESISPIYLFLKGNKCSEYNLLLEIQAQASTSSKLRLGSYIASIMNLHSHINTPSTFYILTSIQR